MSSPHKPSPKPSRVAKMLVRHTWRKKLNHCNSSHEVDVTLPTPMPNPQSPINEPTTHSNHVLPQSHSLPHSDCDTNVGQSSISPSINQPQTQPPLPPSPSREMLMNDINQLQDLSNLLAMHLSQRNTSSSPYSPNLPHTINLDQVEQHVGYCPCYIFTQKQFLTLSEDIN
ncbi:hypothetical protein Tco_0139416 [Tanacetum coccineum]